MDCRKNGLLMIVVFVLNCIVPFSITAMLSKAQRTLEEQRYTQEEMAKYQEEMAKYKELGDNLNDACSLGKLTIVQSLIKLGADVNYYSDSERSPLYCAIATDAIIPNNNIDVVQYLVEQAADVNRINNLLKKLRVTALHAASELEKLNVVIFLVDHGAALEAKSIAGETPLFSACYTNKDIKVVSFLITRKADVNTKNIYNQTALIGAVHSKHYNIAKELLKAGADVNVKNKWGETALHYACFYQNVEMTEALLKAGADAYAEEVMGIRPIDIACIQGNNKIIAVFNKYGVLTKSQEQADQAMHKFFEELNQEELKKAEKLLTRKQKKQIRAIEQKKQEVLSKKQTAEEKQTGQMKPQEGAVLEGSSQERSSIGKEEVLSVNPLEPIVVTVPSISPPIATVVTSPLMQNRSVIREGVSGYQVVEGPRLKWPRSLPAKQEKLIEEHFKQLKNWPNHGLSDIKQLKGQSNKFRLRVGGYRITFSVNTGTREIKIEQIGLRKNIYKRL